MIKIYHNPRCSKSRETLKILEASGHEFKTIEYLVNPPSVEELELFLKTFGDSLSRKKEDEYKPYRESSLSLIEWAKILNQTPKLMERPLVVKGHQMIIGRPPESINTIL